MKIGVVGVGALGGYYGGLLHRAGAEVHLLLRTDYDMVRSKAFGLIAVGKPSRWSRIVISDPKQSANAISSSWA